MDYPAKNPAFPQTDTRQTERQRERHGNIADASEQELANAREILRHAPHAPGRNPAPRYDDPSTHSEKAGRSATWH